tara:strand:- start:4470 stop:4985 length:516 start_codon:yes stop_codon:yes gene_type:complete
MNDDTLIGKHVAVSWHQGDSPSVGKVIRKERGYYILEDSLTKKEIPFLRNSLFSISIVEKPEDEKKGLMSQLWCIMNRHKLKTLFVSGVVIDFWANWYSYAIVHDWIYLQAMLGFFLPILNFPFIHWFIDETNIRERFKMTLITAFSMVIGSTFLLIMIRHGFGVGTDFIP